MNIPMDSPPPYSLLDLSTPNVAILEAGQNYEVSDHVELLENAAFEDKTTRIAFIQKVLATKLMQLLGMCAVMGLFKINRWRVTRFMYSYQENNAIHLIVMFSVLHIIMYLLLVGCYQARRKNPYQQLFLVGYPLSLSLFISVLAVFFEVLEPILLSFIYYCVFLFVLLIYNVYACQSQLEFVPVYGILVGVLTQFVMYISTVPFMDLELMQVSYPTTLMLLEYTYIIYDLKAMTSNYWYSLKPDEYIYGTLNLHVDYFNIIYNSTMCTAIKRRLTRVAE